MEFEDEFVVTGDFDGLVEFNGLPEEETDSEDRLGAVKPLPELTTFSAFGALQPAVKNKSADKQIENNLRDCT